MFASLGGLH